MMMKSIWDRVDVDPEAYPDWLAEDPGVSELEWKERCVNNFLDAMGECLKFMTYRELLKLMVEES
jgi:hypothetical protein